jgi:peptidoglycan hydrolase-like amidase
LTDPKPATAGPAKAAVVALTLALAGSCRTLPPARTSAARPPAEALAARVAPPAIKVGILVDAARASVGADSGLLAQTATGTKELPRATLVAVAAPAGGAPRLRLLETGEELASVLLGPVNATELLALESAPYRGLLEVRAAEDGTLTVVNLVNIEDYLRGVVPNELSPAAFPQMEGLKAQAVAARTYALRNRGQYSSKGFDICATPACQVYRGRASEHALTDRAVEETRGLVLHYRGGLINALYTSTCGGHTEDGGNIFEGEGAPYLRGVACAPERAAWTTVRTTVAARDLGGLEGLARDASLLASLGVLEPAQLSRAALQGFATGEELSSWTSRLVAALHRSSCPVEAPEGSLHRRGTYFRHLVDSLCWRERAQRLLAPGDVGFLLKVEDRAELSEAESMAAALLVQEGILSPFGDNTLRPAAPLTRVHAVALLARAAEKAGPPALLSGSFRKLEGGEITLEQGEEGSTSYPLSTEARLFRALGETRLPVSELDLLSGDPVRLVVHGGRVDYLEAEQSRLGAAADHTSRYYRWEVRLTPTEVGKAVARYGSVGQVQDVSTRQLGVSGRVVKLAVVGSDGELLLEGLRVRWGLGLRENLFVVDRERDAQGTVERFVFTGKGWGHGVGLCQVGAYGMAQSGSDFDAILKHYYTGVTVDKGY